MDDIANINRLLQLRNDRRFITELLSIDKPTQITLLTKKLVNNYFGLKFDIIMTDDSSATTHVR